MLVRLRSDWEVDSKNLLDETVIKPFDYIDRQRRQQEMMNKPIKIYTPFMLAEQLRDLKARLSMMKLAEGSDKSLSDQFLKSIEDIERNLQVSPTDDLDWDKILTVMKAGMQVTDEEEETIR